MTTTVFTRRSNLPADVSSFVGRRQELAQLRAALGTHRLVTLFGPGGVGKTRLAIRVARDRLKTYADGPWFIELAPLQDPALVADTVATTLGLRDTGGASPVERLAQHLQDRELLLVLDNCEHVNDAAATLAAELLARCPGVHVLATSRHMLDVTGEHLIPVSPLAVPSVGRESTNPERLLRYDAVRLFVERATASLPSFRITPENQSSLAELVRRLDGVPLAIELASGRIRVLTPQQILERLEDRFLLLTKGDRAATGRQQTLRALIDWSYGLLSDDERQLWQRASVFTGSFTLEAVEAVCGGTADLVDNLVTKSIIERDSSDGEPRFRMLQSIQEYGAVKLEESGDADKYVARHREYYAGLVEQWLSAIYGPDQVQWFHRLVAEHDNLRGALEAFAGDWADAADGLRMAAGLQHYWVMSGRFSEARRWLDRLLSFAPEPTIARAAGLEVAGRLAVLQADQTTGLALLDQAQALATDLGDATWRAHALHGQAIAALFWGEPATAIGLLDEALALHRTGTDPFGAPLALVQLATAHATVGEMDQAVAYADECIAMSEAVSERWCAALARFTQALTVWNRGEVSRARTSAQETLRLKQPFGDRMGMAMSIELIAWAAAHDGRYDEAAKLMGAVLAAMRSIGATLFRPLQGSHDACVEACRNAMGAEHFQQVLDEGALLSFDEAVGMALGRRTAAPTGAEPEQVVRLTKRETEVAALVAEGLTNREIADRAFISQRTAEGHVDRIMRKLGFTARSQIAAWVVESRRSSGT
ncbi:MAG TPA: LuxR C-terminal-related transcriptional regulator [Nocardioidaceae bacterium]|nr:LuxR C-terminal-related transcriptional regulator [Nocardioidaceae bacterium]